MRADTEGTSKGEAAIGITVVPSGVGPSSPRINLDLKTQVVYVNVIQFLGGNAPVNVNVTVKNNSPYSSATLFYQVSSLDSNVTVHGWSEGEQRVLKLGGETNLTIQTSVPLNNPFTVDTYRLEAKLSLPRGDMLQAETTFKVEKTGLQNFLRNTAVLSLCGVLVGLAYYSYQHGKPQPWKKYPEPRTT